ncbi:MAG: hypothetical protein JWO06_221 [Bacteroidota bacterium]|nr:hypothetical protein [Bacteroidota bacterium]
MKIKFLVTLYAIVFSALAFLAGCGAKLEPTPVVTTQYAVWQVKDSTYTATSVVRVDSNQLFACNGVNSYQVFFSVLPKTQGFFKIVSEDKAATHSLAANECAIEFNRGANDVYLSTGNYNDSILLSITDGKMEIAAPSIRVYHYGGSGLIDSTTAGGNMHE